MQATIIMTEIVLPASLVARNKARAIGFDAQWTPEPNCGCWLWFGYCDDNGYGKLLVDGIYWLAHRYSWHRHVGPIPKGICVLHRCDNPPCINPDHLFLGTRADNNRDRARKGRGARMIGTTNPNARITWAEARAIRIDPRPQSVIAADYRILQPQVSRIKLGITWKEPE